MSSCLTDCDCCDCDDCESWSEGPDDDINLLLVIRVDKCFLLTKCFDCVLYTSADEFR